MGLPKQCLLCPNIATALNPLEKWGYFGRATHLWRVQPQTQPTLGNPPQNAKNPCTVGIAGRCEHEVGASATHLIFSCLRIDPAAPYAVRPYSPFRNLPNGGANSSCCPITGWLSARSTKAHTGRHGGSQRGYICMTGASSLSSVSIPPISISLSSKAASKRYSRSREVRYSPLNALKAATDTSWRS